MRRYQNVCSTRFFSCAAELPACPCSIAEPMGAEHRTRHPSTLRALLQACYSVQGLTDMVIIQNLKTPPEGPPADEGMLSEVG